MNVEAVNQNIHINQIGYRTNDKKVAIINGKVDSFNIIEKETGKSIFSGKTSGGIFDESSGDTLFYCDFTDVKENGTYYVSVPGFGRSYYFNIDNHVYKDVKNSMLKALFYQRCGMELEEKHAGLWKHSVCHVQDAYVYEQVEKTMDGTGGWHDAGDYGKYTVSGAYAVAYLLYAYKLFPDAFRDEINIPESGNGVPDILNEARYELEWLLKMQDEFTGGVSHKLTSKLFPDDLNVGSKAPLPENDISDLYLFPISSMATADFAAIMALSADIYKPVDKEFSEKCLAAAEKAWVWLSNNKDIVKFYNPPDVNTGRFGDTNDKDERYWAAAELYHVTGKKEYHEYFISSFNNDNIEPGFMWRDVGGFGDISYLLTDINKVSYTVYKEIKYRLISMADSLYSESMKNGYLISLPSDAYIWGSNSILMNAAVYLIIAGILTGEDRYIQVSQYHLHNLFGQNALNQCYVTGIGSKPVRNPHHRPSFADDIEQPVPGLVSAGPNQTLQDKNARLLLQGKPPARCFIDDASSFSTNENSIYWNTQAVFVSGYFDK